jgi:hypothetical protein
MNNMLNNLRFYPSLNYSIKLERNYTFSVSINNIIKLLFSDNNILIN